MILVKSSKSIGFFKRMLKSAVIVLCLSFVTISFAACSFDPFSSANKSVSSSGATFNSAESKEGKTPAPPGLQVPAANSGQAQTPFQPALGLNTQKLFDQPLSNENDRFLRLEAAVQDIRDDFNDAAPAITRLVAVEKDIQELVVQLETLLDEEPAQQWPQPTVQSEPLPLDTAIQNEPTSLVAQPKLQPQEEAENAPQASVKKPFSPPQSTNKFDGLRVIRMADSAGKTRIVFESSHKMSPTLDLDNAENILAVDFSKGKTSVEMSRVKRSSKLVKDISETRKEDGFVIIFALAKSSKILAQGYIPPGPSTSNHRFYIDLKK